MNFVLLEVCFNGYSRSEVENEIVSVEFFEKYNEELNNILSNITYSDFDGKHGHVCGDYSFKYLDFEETKKLFINSEIEGFIRCFDCLCDYLSDYEIKELKEDVIKISNLFNSFNLSIDFSGISDTESEKLKIINLLEKSGYKIL